MKVLYSTEERGDHFVLQHYSIPAFRGQECKASELCVSKLFKDQNISSRPWFGKPRGKYSVSACCTIWRTLSVVVGPLFAEQNTPLQPLRYRLLPVQLPPRFSLAPADSKGRVEVTVDSIQTVQTPPLSAVRVVPCSAEQYSGQ